MTPRDDLRVAMGITVVSMILTATVVVWAMMRQTDASDTIRDQVAIYRQAVAQHKLAMDAHSKTMFEFRCWYDGTQAPKECPHQQAYDKAQEQKGK